MLFKVNDYIVELVILTSFASPGAKLTDHVGVSSQLGTVVVNWPVCETELVTNAVKWL